MRARIAALAFGMAVASAPALAQSAPGFYYHGSVALEYFQNGSMHDSVGLLDFNVGVAPQAMGSWGNLGFEAGVFAYGISNGSRGHVFNAALTTDVWGGRLSIGAPRPGALGYVTNPVPGGSLIARLELGTLTGHIPFSTAIAMAEGEPGYGVRFERSSGATSYAVSLARQNWMGNATTAFSAGARSEIGRAHVFGALDVLSGSSTRSQFTLGASTTMGSVEVGASASGVMWSGPNTAAVMAWATVHPLDRLGVTASLLHRVGSSTTYYGLAGSYELWHNGSVELGVLGASGSSNTLVSLGLRQALER